LILGTVAGTIVEFRERHQRARAAAQVVSSPPKRSLSLPVLQPLPAAETESGQVRARRGSAVVGYFRDSVLQAVEIIRSIYLWIIVGVMLSAALTTWLPMGSIQSWLGPQGSWLQTPVALLISVPLYVCATASVPVAAALVHSGLSVGATIVFLMAGPATNLATIGAIFRSFSRGAFVTYLVTIVIGSVAAAFVFDELITGKWLALPVPGHEHPAGAGSQDHGGGHPPGHDHRHWLNQGSAIGLLLLFGWFAAQSGYRRWCGLPGGHDPHGLPGGHDPHG
jgi:uncharacterized protein